MKQKVKFVASSVFALLIAFSLASCGSSQEKIIKQQIDAMNDYADEFEKDPKSDKLAKIEKRLEEIRKKAEGMKDPSESESAKLKDKYGADLTSAAQRYMKAKIGIGPGGLEDMLKGIQIPKQ